jgi:hypothetical protein
MSYKCSVNELLIQTISIYIFSILLFAIFDTT